MNMHNVRGMVSRNAEQGCYDRRDSFSMGTIRYYYYAYGLRISSQLKLPELLPTREEEYQEDVEILSCEFPESLEGVGNDRGWGWARIADTRCQFMIKGVARYQVEQGRRILVDRRVIQSSGQRGRSRDVRVYLLGTALGIVLHQRCWLPLHVSALLTPSGVWAFTGPSGSGKSTLAAWLHFNEGWPLVSDDVAVIKPDDTSPYLYPGPTRIKLWKDALGALGIQRCGLVRDLTRVDKYHIALERSFQPRPHRLRALVVLQRAEKGEKASLSPVKGVEAFKAIMATLYRAEVGKAFNTPEHLLRNVAKLAQRIEVYRYRRSWSLDGMTSNLRPLVWHIDKANDCPSKMASLSIGSGLSWSES
ncbi:hypothetical protein [Halomonas kalidii]|uniref:HPr kinase/phosphorylase C-terminal domain-containing protein n=1 Tax=Halomonas kalidii TaxID=3043293 RepID=A0ABT6VN33_9GAMM|nr:hypothetical protein [Halomonas kalidii]MDI5934176.1 hypothetical protein [Halomonas kalidii]